jgi:hypothetical protein
MTPTKLRADHHPERDLTPEERILRDVYADAPQIMVVGTEMIRQGWILCTKGDEVIFMGLRSQLYGFLKGEMGRFDTMLVNPEDLKDLESKTKSMAANIVQADKGKVQ